MGSPRPTATYAIRSPNTSANARGYRGSALAVILVLLHSMGASASWSTRRAALESRECVVRDSHHVAGCAFTDSSAPQAPARASRSDPATTRFPFADYAFR